MYDFVIIGGGIIGMSTAMQLIEIYPDARIALLEKETGPACHQTGHNSGVIHAGVYYTPAASRRSFASPATAPPRPFASRTASAMTSAAKCWSPPRRWRWSGCAPCGIAPPPTACSASG